MSVLYSSREPIAALGKLCLIWEFAISCPDPCCLHPEGCDMVENDLPAQHIPYLGNEHCVFAFPQTQEENHRLFPNLKQVLSFSQGGYPAFPLLRIANDAIAEAFKRTPGWPIIVFLERPKSFLKRKETGGSDTATQSPRLYFKKYCASVSGSKHVIIQLYSQL